MSEPWLSDRASVAISSGPAGGVDLFLDRLQRQGHVRAGVAVRNREDVEAIEGSPVGDQSVAVSTHDGGKVGCREAVRCREAMCCSHAAALVYGASRWCQGTATRYGDRSSDRSQGTRSVQVRRGWYPCPPMAAVCEVCGKHSSVGMSVSHSHRRTKRRWYPNIQRVRAIVGGSPRRLSVCTSCIRAGKVTKPAR